MEKRYKVKKSKANRGYDDNHAFQQVGIHLAENYGLLEKFKLDEVVTIWRKYSDTFEGSNWMEPNRKDVERAFNVELEEVMPKSGAW